MKTFKLVSLSVLQEVASEQQFVEVELLDGLIINREDPDNRWILEAFLEKSYLALFDQYKHEQKQLHMEVTISHKSNDPAYVVGTIMTTNEFEEHISVLFDAKIERNKLDRSGTLLAQLLKEGLQGDDLLIQFNTRLKEDRKKPTSIK